MLSEAVSPTKCIREGCNKPAIYNAEWDYEYCSNECVVKHCRNVFKDWLNSLKSSSKPGTLVYASGSRLGDENEDGNSPLFQE